MNLVFTIFFSVEKVKTNITYVMLVKKIVENKIRSWVIKGQLISKGLFGGIVGTKKPIFQGFLP